MEIVIKIPDKIYKFVQNTSFVENESTLFKQTSADRQKTLFLFDILDVIKNGTPLPEHHGRLIDETDLKTLYGLDDRLWWGNAVAEFTDLPTILEADKGSEDNACLDESYKG